MGSAHRRRSAIRLRAVSAPARATAVPALAVGAVARRQPRCRRVAARPARRRPALRVHAVEFGHRLFGLPVPARDPRAGRGDLRPGTAERLAIGAISCTLVPRALERHVPGLVTG